MASKDENKQMEDAYQMGFLTAKIDDLSNALKQHMVREEETTRSFSNELKKLRMYIFLTVGVSIGSASPELLSLIKTLVL